MLVYIAGPYKPYPGRTTEQNIQQAREMSIALWDAGYTTICPHLNTSNFENDTRVPDEVFLLGYLEMLTRCDAIVLTPDWEMSSGAKAEVDRANQLGIPCYVYPDKPQLRPSIGSLWRSRKTKDVYQVGVIAVSSVLMPGEESREFVVHSQKPVAGKHQYYVQHAEMDLIGMVFYVESRKIWAIDWDYDDDILGAVQVDAWARPLEMWGEKFTRTMEGL